MPRPRSSPPRALRLLLLAALCAPAAAQNKTFELTDQGWTATKQPEPGTDAAVIASARAKLADKKFSEAIADLDTWIEANETTKSQYLPEAYLLRGDCKLADEDEFESLYDYEKVAKDYAGSEFFVRSLEREFEVAKLYLGGLRKKTFGIRIDDGTPIAEEIILRINERLPGSRLGETAMLALADFYYNTRDLRMAAETYDVFLRLFPRSEHRQKAMQRRVYANIAQFKGPQYDASGLVEARFQIQRFQQEFPAQAEKSGMGDALVARLDESAAEQRLVSAQWYLRRGDLVSARLTLQRLLHSFPGTGATEQAIKILKEHNWPLEAPKLQPQMLPEKPAATKPAAPAKEGPK
ncbi:MAG: outer membrane protein assembly factor BamD [Planctomycetes bacterium]|nr:outer membrane protein assembly factor BamD [Planctomycetota bacterium]